MGMTIYAGAFTDDPEIGRTLEPVIGFACWHTTRLAPDADAREERDEDPFIPNPDYIPHGGMDLATPNARYVFGTLGFPISASEGGEWPIADIQAAAQQALDAGTGLDAYLRDTIGALLAVITTGIARGATHLTVH